ncbi:hypothetical protein N8703_05670, partial [Verrucomicrobia bacterium]|nr:hypothetical protein [Verrucomicrobiota bacterium]
MNNPAPYGMKPSLPQSLESGLRVNRRHFFGRGSTGIGVAALASLMERKGLLSGTGPGMKDARMAALPSLPHHPAKAKRIIYLFQNGAPTHV